MSTEHSSNASPTNAPAVAVTVKSLLASANYQKSFEKVLGERAPQFMASVANLAANTGLKDADPKSVVGSAFIAATLDLPVDRNLGFAHIVAYNQNVKLADGSWVKKKVAQFQMGYKGFIQLALRTGKYISLNDVVIPEGVLINFDPLTGALDLDWSKKKSDDAIGYAFFFKLENGFSKTVYWSHEKVLAHAKRFSKAFSKADSPWQTSFDAMALKTLIKFGLSRYGILSIQMQGALAADQAVKPDVDSALEFPDSNIVDLNDDDEAQTGAVKPAASLGLGTVDKQPPPPAPVKVAPPSAGEAQIQKKLLNEAEGLALDLDMNLDDLRALAGLAPEVKWKDTPVLVAGDLVAGLRQKLADKQHAAREAAKKAE